MNVACVVGVKVYRTIFRFLILLTMIECRLVKEGSSEANLQESHRRDAEQSLVGEAPASSVSCHVNEERKIVSRLIE
jgi:hypothetical protein